MLWSAIKMINPKFEKVRSLHVLFCLSFKTRKTLKGELQRCSGAVFKRRSASVVWIRECRGSALLCFWPHLCKEGLCFSLWLDWFDLIWSWLFRGKQASRKCWPTRDIRELSSAFSAASEKRWNSTNTRDLPVDWTQSMMNYLFFIFFIFFCQIRFYGNWERVHSCAQLRDHVSCLHHAASRPGCLSLFFFFFSVWLISRFDRTMPLLSCVLGFCLNLSAWLYFRFAERRAFSLLFKISLFFFLFSGRRVQPPSSRHVPRVAERARDCGGATRANQRTAKGCKVVFLCFLSLNYVSRTTLASPVRAAVCFTISSSKGSRNSDPCTR